MTDSENKVSEGENNTTTESAPPEVEFLLSKLGEDKIGAFKLFRGEYQITVDPSIIVQVLESLRDEFTPSYNYLSFVTADHWLEAEPPYFNMIYHLLALPDPGTRLMIIAKLPDTKDASIESVSGLYPTANWHEREVYDLFGIKFNNHPNLKRILTPETYPEHPLRRDFPGQGPGLMEFHDRLIAQWNTGDERDYEGSFGDKWVDDVQDQYIGDVSLERLLNSLGYGDEAKSMGDVGYETYLEKKNKNGEKESTDE